MILVTGGTGLVGSHLILELLKAGNSVRAIHRKNSNLPAVKKIFSYYISAEESEFLFNSIQWMEADLNDVYTLSEAFKDITTVYHCAALISFDPADEKKLRKINIEGTANIANLCIASKVKKLCYVSSISTMDLSPGEKEIRENFTWFQENNHSEYAISKHGAEIEVWRASQEGVPVVILNPGIIIGPGFWDSGSGLLFKRVNAGLNYHFPKTSGFVGVQDVVHAAITAMESEIENEQYIVVSENLKFREVLEMTAESLNKPAPKKALKPWMIKIAWFYQYLMSGIFGMKRELTRTHAKTLFEHTFYNNEKIKSDLAFQFTPVKEVVESTGKIFREEIKKNL